MKKKTYCNNNRERIVIKKPLVYKHQRPDSNFLPLGQSQIISSICSDGRITDTGSSILTIDIECPIGLVIVPVSGNAIEHVHINNNDGREDLHNSLQDGIAPIKDLLRRMKVFCPEATITLEVTEVKSSLEWLREERIWNF